MAIPVVRSHERIDFKRCQKMWYWRWRRGLVPVNQRFGALDLGTWMHSALEHWYGLGTRRNGTPQEHFLAVSSAAIRQAQSLTTGIPDRILSSAFNLQELGMQMCQGYLDYYATDPEVAVLATEIPLEFSLPSRTGKGIIATYKLKPDMVYRDPNGHIWLMETKTATTIRTEHLRLDDQARPYAAMAARSLLRVGLIKRPEEFRGITYNFLRKAKPDLRERNADGMCLNKGGDVSKRQPPPFFVREPIPMLTAARRIALIRARNDTEAIVATSAALRTGVTEPFDLRKTPHHSCPKFCDYFSICTAEESGADITALTKSRFRVEDPYAYGETTDDRPTFEN